MSVAGAYQCGNVTYFGCVPWCVCVVVSQQLSAT